MKESKITYRTCRGCESHVRIEVAEEYRLICLRSMETENPKYCQHRKVVDMDVIE